MLQEAKLLRFNEGNEVQEMAVDERESGQGGLNEEGGGRGILRRKILDVGVIQFRRVQLVREWGR